MSREYICHRCGERGPVTTVGHEDVCLACLEVEDKGRLMGKYRKRPIVIEAEQFWPNSKVWPDGVVVDPCEHVTASWWIVTLEGGHVVAPGDWIITGIQGEKYPCKPDIFEATYEAVD